MLRMFVVLESKTGKQRAKSGQNFHENKCAQNSTQSGQKVSCKQRLSKVTWMLKKLVVWG